VDDPVRRLEHAHTHLTKLVLEVQSDFEKLEVLREELLHHFANEEEGLFPFVRRVMPSMIEVVDRLQASHDIICGSLLRMAESPDTPRHFERFEKAYAEHSRDETALLEELGRWLEYAQRMELAEILRGL
jgi:iron-sulfur cluster repair protein YtfE (RIC family)